MIDLRVSGQSSLMGRPYLTNRQRMNIYLLTNAERLAAADAVDVVGSLSTLLAAIVEWSLPVLAIPRVRFG